MVNRLFSTMLFVLLIFSGVVTAQTRCKGCNNVIQNNSELHYCDSCSAQGGGYQEVGIDVGEESPFGCKDIHEEQRQIEERVGVIMNNIPTINASGNIGVANFINLVLGVFPDLSKVRILDIKDSAEKYNLDYLMPTGQFDNFLEVVDSHRPLVLAFTGANMNVVMIAGVYLVAEYPGQLVLTINQTTYLFKRNQFVKLVDLLRKRFENKLFFFKPKI